MKSLEKSFSKFESQIHIRYLSRTFNLLEQLKSGDDFRFLGGRCLEQNRKYIRFKFGSYRLIVRNVQGSIILQTFLHRKNFEAYVKRRCK